MALPARTAGEPDWSLVPPIYIVFDYSGAVAIDLADMVSAVVEARDRGTMDWDLSGGLVFSAAGVATAGIVSGTGVVDGKRVRPTVG